MRNWRAYRSLFRAWGTACHRGDPISLIDIMPSLLTVLGIEAINPVDGQSFAGWLRTNAPESPKGRPLLVCLLV